MGLAATLKTIKPPIYILFSVSLLLSCKKETSENILDGKIKTLEWFDSTSTKLAQYEFIYDSLGNLIKVRNNSLDYLLFDKDGDSVIMSYQLQYMNNDFTIAKKAEIDLQNRILSVFEYNSMLSTLDMNYTFAYNNEGLYLSNESYIPFIIYSADRTVSGYGHQYINGNCVKFYADWGGQFFPGFPVEYHDTIQYTFSPILNDGKIPMQFPLRSYKWNDFSIAIFPQGANMLYMLGIKGYGKNSNKNLIESIKISGSENYSLKFNYTTNNKNEVITMSIANLQTGTLESTFKMNYY